MDPICDLTNELDILSTQIGLACVASDDHLLQRNLTLMIQVLGEVMGSLRRNRELSQSILDTALTTHGFYKERLKGLKYDIFQLPTGSELNARLHLCRAMSKKLSRMYLKVYYKKLSTDERVKDCLEVFSNTFYYMAISSLKDEGSKL